MKLIQSLILFSVSLGILFSSLDLEAPPQPEKQNYELYTITLDGQVDGRQFIRQGSIFVAKAGDEDDPQTHLWLVSGNPQKNAATGSIWLGTVNSLKDLPQEHGWIMANEDQLQVNFRPGEAWASKNSFSLSTNAQENVTELVNGTLQLHLLQNGEIEGTVQILSFDAQGQETVTYTASIRGHYDGIRTW